MSKENKMDGDQKAWLIGIFLAGIIIISIFGICFYGSYIHKVKKYENFQDTIKDLSDEQKCLHICGFQYPATTYFDNYKYCVEKCDRISERLSKS